MQKDYHDLTVTETQELMQTTREDAYQLVDVRLLEEYEDEHLAGAIHIPVGELSDRFAELSPDKATIFYCLSGKRSAAAAVFASASNTFTAAVYNMLGGIAEWDDECVSNLPNLKALDLGKTEAELLYQAMNLEKGAHRFYQLVLDLFPDAAFTDVMKKLVTAEVAHAKMIYAFWKEWQTAPAPFEEVYAGLTGDILEGGHSFATLAEQLRQTDTQCMDVIDMAIAIEFSAYDLYRNMAQLHKNTALEKPLLTLCQSEKDHMRLAAQALDCCR